MSITDAAYSIVSARLRPMPVCIAISAICSSAPRGELAWTVENDPGWPVLIARRKLIVSAAAQLAQHDPVGPQPQRRLQQFVGSNLGLAQLALDRDQADAVGARQPQFGGVFDQHDPFMRGISRSMALRNVVLPVEVPPEIRIVRRRWIASPQ
jgi:hypothetical protein